MKRIPPIKSAMTPFPYAVESTDFLERAVTMMEEHGVHCLPVVERGRVVGLVSDRDARKACEAAVGRPRVQDVCDRGVYVVELTEPLDVVLLEMANRHADPALVVKEGRLVGIFTKTDACRSYCRFLRSLFPRGSDDDAA